MNLDLSKMYVNNRRSEMSIENILLGYESPAAIIVDRRMRVLEAHGTIIQLWKDDAPSLPCLLDQFLNSSTATFVQEMATNAFKGHSATQQFANTFLKVRKISSLPDERVLVTFRQIAQWHMDTIPAGKDDQPTLERLYFLVIHVDQDHTVTSVTGSSMIEKTYSKLLTNSRLTENNSDRLGPDLLADLDRVQKGNRSITRRIPMQGTQFIRQIEQKDDGFSIFLKMDVTAAQNEIERQQFLAAHAELAKSYAMIGLSDNPTAALQSICDYLGTMFSDCRVGIVLFDQEQKRGILAAGTKWPDGVVGKTRAYGIGQTELTAANHSYTVVKVNPNTDAIETPSNFWISAAEEHCFVCRIGRKSAVRGAIVMYSKTLKTVLPTQISAIEGMAAIAGTALRTAMVQAELAENERHYRDLVGGLPILVGITDENFTFLQVNDAFEQLGVNQLDVGETSVSDVFGHEAAALLRRNLFYNDDTTTSCEALIPVPGGEDNYYLLQANRRQDGHPGFYIVALNIDERKKTEVLNKTISEELDHRVKNIIALINSIAFLTSQHTDNIDDFLDTFEDRLSMLGRTHSILAGTKWNGATVYDIVAAEISPFADVNSDRIRIDQTRFDLDVKGVQVIALVIHELTTNAIKYGALSIQSGILNVNWSQTSDDLIINWTESNVIGTKDTDHKGAGTQVIHSTIERQLGGRVERNFTDDGISYQFVIPLIKLTKQSDD